MVSFSLHGATTALAALLLLPAILSSPLPPASNLPPTGTTFTVAGSVNSLTVQVNITDANQASIFNSHDSALPPATVLQSINATLAALFNDLHTAAASSGSKYTVLQNPANVTVDGTIAGIASSPVPVNFQPLTYSDAALAVSGLQEFLVGKDASLIERIGFIVNATLPLESSVFGQTMTLVATGFVESVAADAIAPNPQNTFTVPGSSAPLTVQVFFDGNAPGSTPPALTHPAISTTIASLVKRLSAHASGSPLQRAEQASVDGTMAEIRPETGTSGTGLNYGDTVHAMTALQRFLKDKKVGEEIDFVVDGALHGGETQAEETVVANGFVRRVVAEGRENGE
ncbi:MAG: hypothetical protein OHK93_005891 [Ramalina farinacea]|uniref:Uncharacterized protein n=1 Tax=Ramalina farinacea TaxID=258253 RepID=A0AA43TT12_9LECA|nr:hypothetical protein [Ramalina farinacea]